MNRAAAEVFSDFLNQYEWPEAWRAERRESGMNNTTIMVYSGLSRFVLRVYDNHRDPEKVLIEHMVLNALQQLPFSVPNPISNKTGATITFNSDGKIAALYTYLAGDMPSNDYEPHIIGLGDAAGQLSRVMSGLELERSPAYPPYYELENSYAQVTNEGMVQMARSSNRLHTLEGLLQALFEQRAGLELAVPFIKILPVQWIHGDLVFTNSLSRGDRIAGILDFEFVSRDVRAMEIGVVLNEFIKPFEREALRRIGLFCKGFGSACSLTSDEIRLLPDLMKLRMIDVFLHFAGRLMEGIDGEEVWADQIQRASFVCDWIDEHRSRLERLFAAALLGAQQSSS